MAVPGGFIGDEGPSRASPAASGDNGLLLLSREGTILAYNRKAEDILRSRLCAGSRLPSDCAFARQVDSPESPVRRALDQEVVIEDLLDRVNVMEGVETPVRYSLIPFRDRDDRPSGVMIAFHDLRDVNGPAEVPLPRRAALCCTALLESLVEGMFAVNTRWQIITVNRSLEAIAGYRREELLGRFCWEAFRTDCCSGRCPLRKTMATGENQLDQELQLTSRDGHKVHLLVTSSLVKAGEDRVLGGLQTFRPIAAACTEANGRGEVCSFGEIVGGSDAIAGIFSVLPDIAASDASVLIQGKSGTGKDLIARAIHFNSPRKEGPFVAVNCMALAETLLESELFGHEKGAFTGAVASKPGRFELARGGTLFLDEVGELKPEIQVKLLRVLETKVFERVGGTRPIPLEARIIAATNRDVADAIKTGLFREDLYFRLSTVPLFLPALKDRPGDVPLLVDRFIKKLNRATGKKVRGVDPKLMKWLCRYHWPGNVRELEHVMEYAFVFVRGPIIRLRHMPPREDGTQYGQSWPDAADSPDPLADAEKRAILDALAKTGGKRAEAARLLNISRGSLWRKMKQHGVG